jgi:UDP-N-acetylmuramoyl-tripeptide--D-alanyl-D-alanine ligase
MIQADKKMAILGQMGELGEESDKEHRLLVDRLQSAGYDDVWLVGDNFKDIDCPFRKFHDTEEVKAAIKAHCPEGFYILIKGSNSNKLFQLPELL